VSEAKAKHELGDAVAESLKRRVADMRAATTLEDLAAFGANEPTANDLERRVDLTNDHFAVITPNHPKIPRLPSGKTNWAAVTRVRLVRIGPP
jgi:hypothetical protein